MPDTVNITYSFNICTIFEALNLVWLHVKLTNDTLLRRRWNDSAEMLVAFDKFLVKTEKVAEASVHGTLCPMKNRQGTLNTYLNLLKNALTTKTLLNKNLILAYLSDNLVDHVGIHSISNFFRIADSNFNLIIRCIIRLQNEADFIY